MKRRRAGFLSLAFSLLCVAALGAEKGWFGFAVSVDAEGVSLAKAGVLKAALLKSVGETSMVAVQRPAGQ